MSVLQLKMNKRKSIFTFEEKECIIGYNKKGKITFHKCKTLKRKKGLRALKEMIKFNK